jgi:tRNA threonylcarbamoyladenosine biosynthesis protein TsaB
MILALSTSTPQFGAALMTPEGVILGEVASGVARRHFRDFMPAVEQLVEACGRPLDELEAIAVARGPGSFTGLRVGLAAAKGMAHGLGLPLVGVSSLEALAWRIPFSDLPVCSVIDSRKGELFCGVYRRSAAGPLTPLRDETCLPEENLPEHVEGPAVFIGNDHPRQAPLIRKLLADRAFPAPPALWHPAASAVGALGLERLRRGETDDLRDLVPVYFRPPDIRTGPVQAPLAPGDPRQEGP